MSYDFSMAKLPTGGEITQSCEGEYGRQQTEAETDEYRTEHDGEHEQHQQGALVEGDGDILPDQQGHGDEGKGEQVALPVRPIEQSASRGCALIELPGMQSLQQEIEQALHR